MPQSSSATPINLTVHPSSMEDLVARIQITSGPQQALALLTSPSTTELLQSERHEALAIALSLDPRQQALAMLYLLCVVGVGGLCRDHTGWIRLGWAAC